MSGLPSDRIDKLAAGLKALAERDQAPILDTLEFLVAQAGIGDVMSEAHRAEVTRRLSGPPEFASDADVEAFFARNRH